jgi:hypothetical protein
MGLFSSPGGIPLSFFQLSLSPFLLTVSRAAFNCLLTVKFKDDFMPTLAPVCTHSDRRVRRPGHYCFSSRSQARRRAANSPQLPFSFDSLTFDCDDGLRYRYRGSHSPSHGILVDTVTISSFGTLSQCLSGF